LWESGKPDTIAVGETNSHKPRGAMKPAPAPNVPGNTEAERMSNALRMVLTVSKKDLLKKEASEKRAHGRKPGKKIRRVSTGTTDG